ncbi:NAD synthase family protein, partial [Vibrio parahaemolyticus V-223/04]
LCKHQTRC